MLFEPLSGHPDVSVRIWDAWFDEDGRACGVHVRYIGPSQALIEASAASVAMLQSQARTVEGLDEEGDRYAVTRCWTGRLFLTDGPTCQLTRVKSLERALNLPGVSTLWPRYLERQEAQRRYHEQIYGSAPPVMSAKLGISKSRAVDIALDHVVRSLRARLELELDPELSCEPGLNSERSEDFADVELPAALRAPNVSAELPLATEVNPIRTSGFEARRRRRPAWCVYIPDEHMGVGASRIIRIDVETGEVLSDREEGE